MRVDSSSNWAIASRDLFKATGCEHCVRLSMAVKAKVGSVLSIVAPYEEDLSTKLPIIQGNQRERIVFDQIRSSLPERSFVELARASPEETIAAMRNATPVIAQGYFERKLRGYTWSGYADLLVLEGYEVSQEADGRIAVKQVSQVPEPPKYMPWDVKNSADGDPKYQVQLAAYLEALQALDLASDQPMGIVLGFDRGIVRYDLAESTHLYRGALEKLVAILNQTTPNTITEEFVDSWTCAKESVCKNVYCDYPRLCSAGFKSGHVLELLHGMHHTHSPKLRAAGFNDVSALARADAAPEVPGLTPEFSERYWKASKMMQMEFDGKKALLSKFAGSPSLPEPTLQDVFFDVEWFNPVDATGEFIFMFGVVGADESFEAFTAEALSDELIKFDEFLDYGLDRLNANSGMHIYHYHNPEPKKVDMLVKRYGGHRAADAEALIARMVDLRPVAMAAFVPGSGSYSIKSLEKYYDADSKLGRGGLVAGGADAMYQFELFRVAHAEGKRAQAEALMKVIADYNKDDCLSTKLLYDWLRGLEFAAADQILVLA